LLNGFAVHKKRQEYPEQGTKVRKRKGGGKRGKPYENLVRNCCLMNDKKALCSLTWVIEGSGYRGKIKGGRRKKGAKGGGDFFD